MTFAETRKEINNIGLFFMKMKEIKSNADFEKEIPEIQSVMTTLFYYGCKELVTEARTYFLSVGIDKELVDTYIDEREVDSNLKLLQEESGLL